MRSFRRAYGRAEVLPGLLFCALGFLMAIAPAVAAPVVDGTRDGLYGSALAVQTVQTQFGDNLSEMDAAYALADGGNLYLMLTGNAREVLASVDTVIVDEIHSLVPTKRGAHLFTSLERLEELRRRGTHAEKRASLQRIGLSATQRPLDEVARFLGGAALREPAVSRRPRAAPRSARAATPADVRESLHDEFAADDDGHDPRRDATLGQQRDQHAGDEQLVGGRVQERAELARDVPAAGQAAVIVAAQSVAQVHPEGIGYVEAHGTGTPLGDPVEIAALTQAFRTATRRNQFCAVGSLKSNLGHLDAAAGVAGLIKAVLALEREEIPPTVHFQSPNPEHGAGLQWSPDDRLILVQGQGIDALILDPEGRKIEQPSWLEAGGESWQRTW